ncbi:uncharacterized protein I303_107673 [Kwoniella dejecticola CBS 10117]|uniref:Uncharacterized protein n=1 Tax=Kwoniella dejecticola CBS 10117 TaxID=1296121 RepID=A0A1A5ZVE3_9TREE|nr:uncharacterized protein I303_07682 [Kwoniella dejecticola CBS 10117]OBR81772.1 hypothetical protein I303_07682 [Kwoniella dejecticola CBS 10117]
MNTFISASSPLFRYQPCKACDVTQGFQTGADFSGRDYNGTESGMITQRAGTSVSVNCTGTGISFDISYNSPNISSFKPSIKVNGSLPTSSQNATSTSIRNLPLAQHTFELDIIQSNASSSTGGGTSTSANNTVPMDWIRINGATCNLGYAVNAQTKNETIDDTAWRDWKVYLTPGWNMLEKDASNYIDLDQYQAEVPTSSRDYNGSISWTEQPDAANQIFFKGSAVWVHGIVGDRSGSYEVILDNVTHGIFDASGGPRVYNSVLYHTSNLADTNHSIMLRNIEEGKRLSFDRLLSMSGLTPLTNTLPSPSPSPPASETNGQVEVSSYYPSSTSSAGAQSGIPTSLSGGAIAGIVIAASIVVAAFLVTWIFAWLRKRKEQRINEETESRGIDPSDNEKAQTTFFRFSSRGPSPSPNPAHPFHPLPSPRHPQGTMANSLQNQHPIPTPNPAPRRPTTSRLFNFASPTPSLRSFIQNHTTSSVISDNTNSFLKINNSRFSRSKHNNQQNERETIADRDAAEHHAVHPHLPKKSISGLNISNPQPIIVPIQRKDSEDYLPSLAPTSSQVRPLNPQKSSEKPKAGPRIPPSAPVRSMSDNLQAVKANASEQRSNSMLGSIRRETLSPFVAALSGKTASPLAELSRSTSQRANANQNPNQSQTHPLGGARFGRRKQSLDSNKRKSTSNSLKTEKTNFTTFTEYTEGEGEGEGDNEAENGILSMYAKFPPGSNSQRNTQYPAEEGMDDNLSGVGVALGSPMQDNNFQWEANGSKIAKDKDDPGFDEDDEFRPPTRRFLGLGLGSGNRPDSGVSNKSGKSASSVGSGWRYM